MWYTGADRIGEEVDSDGSKSSLRTVVAGKGGKMTHQGIGKNSLVLYKTRPALVVQAGKKSGRITALCAGTLFTVPA